MASIQASLAAAQAKMENPPLDGLNPHFNSRFSTLGAVLGSVRAPLNEAGLFLNQTLEDGFLKTVVWNGEGESAVVCSIPCQLPADPQKAGSALTYARRYSLLAAFGLAGDPDDDAESAAAKEPPKSGAFTARCRTCGVRYRFDGAEAYTEFLATPGAMCCAHPDWRVE